MIALGILLQGSGGRPSYFSVPLRVSWLSWLLLSAVIPTVHLSAMKSFQAAPNAAFSPSNFEELAEAGLQAMSTGNAVVAKLQSNSFVYPSNMYGTMVQRLRFKNITTLLELNLCKIYSAMYANEFDLYPLSDACMQMSSVHLFAMTKRSVFTDAVSSRMMRLTQEGIIQRTWSGNNTLPRYFVKKTQKLSLKAMLPSFLVLTCG